MFEGILRNVRAGCERAQSKMGTTAAATHQATCSVFVCEVFFVSLVSGYINPRRVSDGEVGQTEDVHECACTRTLYAVVVSLPHR